MLPFKSILTIQADSRLPLYNKIANAVIEQISNGTLQSGNRLPSSRQLAEILGVHRKTIVAAYDELLAQGWIQTFGRKGTFVNDNLPRIDRSQKSSYPITPIKEEQLQHRSQPLIRFDDGYPDIRLAPLTYLAREYSSLLKNRHFIHGLNYTSEFFGDIFLRQEICTYLFDTRGIYVDPDHILISRGSIMAFYLIINTHIEPGDIVIAGTPGYGTFNEIVKNAQGKLEHVKVDEDGIDVEEVEAICKNKKVKFLYAISHHHHPTTVTLSADRRIRLIELAKKYNFSIIEDDYDYDFHYESSPVLPLASLQHQGRVFYVGSFSKTIAPSLRMGFVVAHPAAIKRLAQCRRFIDRTGDPVLERATAHLLKFGEVRRHLNKALRLYKSRRNLMMGIFDTQFAKHLSYNKPEGGMAIWTKFNDTLNINQVIDDAAKNGLQINHPIKYGSNNYTRIGFASVNEEEIKKGLGILKSVLASAPLSQRASAPLSQRD